jgi:hypothetical protein
MIAARQARHAPSPFGDTYFHGIRKKGAHDELVPLDMAPENRERIVMTCFGNPTQSIGERVLRHVFSLPVGFTLVTRRQRRSEELTPLPDGIILLKGEVSNRSRFSMSAALGEAIPFPACRPRKCSQVLVTPKKNATGQSGVIF